MLRTVFLLSIIFLMPAYGQEAEPDAGAPKKFSGEGSLGLIINSGNTENENLNANLKASYESAKWKHSFGIDAKKTTEDDITTAERYVLSEKSDYSFGEKTYAFGAFRYDDDRFSGFEYQASVTAGIGRRIIKNARSNLNIELGAGYKENKIELTGETEDDSIARLAGEYNTRLTENSRFSQTILVESGESNTSSESVTGIKVAMNSKLALQFTYTVKHNSDPPPANETTDRTTAVALVYSF